MALSSDLVSQFVKITKDDKKVSSGTTVYGTVVYDDKLYVKLDGSELLTPVSTTTNVKDGERVTVTIKDHTATINGNLSSPSARTKDVETVANQVSEFEIVTAHKVTADDIQVVDASIENLITKLASIDNLDANVLTVINAEIESLKAQIIEGERLEVEDIDAITATLESIEARVGEFDNISTEDLYALNGEITKLKGYTADFTYISAVKASVKELDATKASVEDLTATNANIENLGTKYANIDFANIGEAAIRKIFSESGLIKDLVVGDGTVTGELVGVTIKGDLIEGNTVKADKLVVKGSDGIYYKLNFEAGTFANGEAVPTDSLHGSVITAKSITAEKVSVKDLVAFGATIGGFHITDTSLYSGVKDTAGNTTRGVYLDNDGQLSVGDANNFLKYFKDKDDTYKLAISAGSILLSTTGKTVEETIDDSVDNIKIGGRNLIRNSTTLVDDDYYFSSGVATTATNTVSGRAVTIPDMATEDPGLEVSVSSGAEGFDPSTVTVIACGKNLIDFTSYTVRSGWYIAQKTGDCLRSTTGYDCINEYIPISHLQGLTVSLNYPVRTTWYEFNQGIAFYGEDNTYISGTDTTPIAIPENAYYMKLSWQVGHTVDELQLELGEEITAFEPYASTQTVTANTDGTVEGLNPIYPTMNIIAGTPGVTVTATYNRSPALSTLEGITPFGDTDRYARFNIEAAQLPEAFIFPGVKTIGQEYTLSFWLKADDTRTVTVNGQSLAATTEWTKQVVTFTADSTDLSLEFGETGMFYIYHLQLEVGNKATDWTLAPEDVSDDISTAQNTALGAKNTADNNAASLALAESTIQQLADSITSLVRDGDGGSLLHQDADGLWFFNIDTIQDDISKTASDLSTLSDDMDTAKAAMESLGELAADLEGRIAYIKMGEDDNGGPCLELGSGQNQFKVRITNNDIQFVDGTTIPTRINRQMLVIEKAMVRDELQFGDDETPGTEGVWVWKRRENGNLGLTWRKVANN